MDQVRIIKKYPNRRLYDTAISRYITLDEVKELVLKNVNFSIVDASTDEDMTNYVLLQIINEQECGGTPIFSADVLRNIIRFYGNPMQKTFSQFLEKSFSYAVEQQSDLSEKLKDIMGKDPLQTMSELTKRSMDMWQSAVNQYYEKKPSQTSETKEKPKRKSKKNPTDSNT